MYDLFSINSEDEFYTSVQNGKIHFDNSFFKRTEADLLLSALQSTIEWNQESMNMYGKNVNLPRLTAWYGDPDRSYSFSGINLKPKEWTNELSDLRKKLFDHCGINFNSLLLNLYRNELDSIGWHQDAEKELGINPVIASISLGGTRRFQLRRIDDHNKKLHFDLGHGSLLIMAGELQHHWQHSIAKSSVPCGARINLTFRNIIL